MTIIRDRSKAGAASGQPGMAAPNRRAPWAWILCLMAIVAILWVPYYSKMRDVALFDPDAEDYAQIARNLAQGRGLTTDFVPLQQLEWMRQTGRIGMPWYNVHRFPLPSVVEAGLFQIFGPTEFAVTLYSALFYFATLPVLYLFAWRLAPRRKNLVATFAVLAFALQDSQLIYSITGKTEAPSTFLFVAALYLVLWPRGLWSLALAGALTGLGYLNRSSALIYAIPMLPLIWRRYPVDPRRAVIAFTVAGTLVVMPWLVRNAVLVGDPMFSVTNATMIQYRAEPGNMANPYFLWEYVKPATYVVEHPVWIFRKWVREFVSSPDGGYTIHHMGVLTPFLIFGLAAIRGRSARELRAWLLLAFLLHLLVLPLTRNSPRYYNIFAPFAFLFAVDAFCNVRTFWRALGIVRFPAAALLVLSLVGPWALAVAGPRGVRQAAWWVESRPRNHDWIRENTPKDALIVSDVPMAVAWYGQRKSTSIPPVPAEMGRFAQYRLHPDGIYLNLPVPDSGDSPRAWGPWLRIYEGHLPVPGFRLARVFANGALYYERIPAGQAPALGALTKR